MQACGIVLLNDESLALARRELALGFGRRLEVALLAVGFEGHDQPAFLREPARNAEPVLPLGLPSAALSRSAAIRSMTFSSLGALRGLIFLPSIFAFTNSASAAS